MIRLRRRPAAERFGVVAAGLALVLGYGCSAYDPALLKSHSGQPAGESGGSAPAVDGGGDATIRGGPDATADGGRVGPDSGPTSDGGCDDQADAACVAACDRWCALRPQVATSTCAAGSCTILSCQDHYANCDGLADNGCERNVDVDGPCLPETSCTPREYQGNAYFFCTNNLTWMEARGRCRSEPRGDLVRIDDQAEADFIVSQLQAESWIGASDSGLEGLWRWADNGVPFWQGVTDGSTVLSQYASWAPGQPDAASTDEDCAKMSGDGSWSDQDCGNVAAFVCEVDPDGCPDDAAKEDPGQCGCGVPDDDADGDGFAACNDACPNDPDKLAPGACGCGVTDTDSDSDAEPDCSDGCPNDPDKLAPGVCGCGVPDVDSDSDSTLDCHDGCPNDPDKVAAGACGCGNLETDSDADGTPDCADACPSNPLGAVAATGCGLGFAPANVDLAPLQPQLAAATTTFDCAAVLDTSGTPSFTTWCSGTKPPITLQSQAGGPELAVVALQALDVRSNGKLTIKGLRPAALIVFGDATISGTIDASASGTTPGAGGNDASCGTSNGGDVTSCAGGSDETGGGGGGGFGTAGGRGGDGDDCGGRDGGIARGNPALVPLLAGCRGGTAGLCSGSGSGAGGGAFQLAVGGTLTLTGSLHANGGAGPGRCSGSNYFGGGGGGSGGAIRVEALVLSTSGASIQANGGKGGSTTSSSGTGTGGNGSSDPGSPGSDASNPTPSPQPTWYGGGGGGGGYGRVVLCDHGANTGCP